MKEFSWKFLFWFNFGAAVINAIAYYGNGSERSLVFFGISAVVTFMCWLGWRAEK